MFTLIDLSGSNPKDWSGNEKHLHSLIRLVPNLRIGRVMRSFILIDSSGSDPKDWSGNEKHLHSLIPLVLTLRIGRIMRNIYTH